MNFALLTVVSRVTDATLERIAAAARIRLPLLDAAWSGIYADLTRPMGVRIVASSKELLDDDVPMICTATLDDPNALAYHDIRDGHPYGLILADDSQTLPSIEQAALHEVLECRLDPSCNLYAGGIALEDQDPLQGDVDGVDLGTGATVPFSPFTLPAYFGFPDYVGQPTNSAGLALSPLGVRPGGYVIKADGSEQFGERYVHPPHKSHFHARRMRRARKRARLVGLTT
jgi:hypothetical protein